MKVRVLLLSMFIIANLGITIATVTEGRGADFSIIGNVCQKDAYMLESAVQSAVQSSDCDDFRQREEKAWIDGTYRGAFSDHYKYYIPYYRADLFGFYTSLALRNSNACSAATVSVSAYESDGTVVSLAAEFTNFLINPSGQWACRLPEIDEEGWVLVTSTQRLTGLAWVGVLDGNWPRLMADVSLIGELNTTLVVPHVAQTIDGCYEDGGWSTKVNICNPHGTTTQAMLSYYTASGTVPYTKTLSIPANGSVSYDLASMLPANQCFRDGSVVITATQTVAAFALYYDVDKIPGADGTCFAGISAVKRDSGTTGSYLYYVPYCKADNPPDQSSPYYTSLALRNSRGTSSATVTVEAYMSDGTKAPLASEFNGFAVKKSGQWARVLPRVNEDGWILARSNQPLTGLAWVGKVEAFWPKIMADISLIGDLAAALIIPHVAQTAEDWSPYGGWNTRVNVCNPHGSATDVTLTYYAASGAPSYATMPAISIPPWGSVSYDMSSMLPVETSFENGSIMITAGRGVAAFALYCDVYKVPCGNGSCYAGINAEKAVPEAVPAVKLQVPFEPNLGNTCFSSSFAMAMRYWDKDAHVEDVLNVVGLPPFESYDHQELNTWMKMNYGLEFLYIPNSSMESVREYLVQGYPVIVHQTFSLQDNNGHNRVVIGYNGEREAFIVNDPSNLGPNYEISYADFGILWSRIASYEPGPPNKLYLVRPLR